MFFGDKILMYLGDYKVIRAFFVFIKMVEYNCVDGVCTMLTFLLTFQEPSRNHAILPNIFLPNYRTKSRQITEKTQYTPLI